MNLPKILKNLPSSKLDHNRKMSIHYNKISNPKLCLNNNMISLSIPKKQIIPKKKTSLSTLNNPISSKICPKCNHNYNIMISIKFKEINNANSTPKTNSITPNPKKSPQPISQIATLHYPSTISFNSLTPPNK